MTPTYVGVVHPRGVEPPPVDPFADDLDAPARGASGTGVAPAGPAGDPFADDHDTPPPPKRQVSGGEALGTAAAEGLTFGFSPALEGVASASGLPEPKTPEERASGAAALRPVLGAAKLLSGYLSGHPDPDVQDAYNRGRQAALENQDLAKEQHPQIYLAGQLAGTLAMPVPGAGAMRAGGIGARAIQGARTGAIGGALYGTGEATSEGASPSDIATRGATTGLIGLGLGGALGAAVGPRLTTGTTPGQQAARTADIIGAPLPRGVVSDSSAVQATTAKLRQVPFAGEKIGERVAQTEEAAGTVAGQSRIQDAIDANRQAIDGLYGNVRGQIAPDRVMPMPRTAAAVQRVKAARTAAGHPNPDQGLEQFENIGQGASFNGAHRARVDAREAGNVATPHPGYNAADYNQITRAMTADIRDNIGRQGGARAQRAFDAAESRFGPLSQANKKLQGILNKHADDPTLRALGFNPATGQFSLAKFVTAVNRLREEHGDLTPFTPSPAHRASIEAIAQMGQHIKGALRESSTSHSASFLVLMDVAKDAALLATDVATGGLGGGTAIGAGSTAALWMFTRWLASPASAASASKWSRAYQTLLASPTPARTTAFNLATRNLANNLGIRAEHITQAVQRRLTAPAEDQGQQ